MGTSSHVVLMHSFSVHRFTALALVGCVLLLVYQFMFMARTSIARDYNHLHRISYTPRRAQQLALHSANATRALETEERLRLSEDNFYSELQTRNFIARHSLKFKYVAALIGNEEVHIELSMYTHVFQYHGHTTELSYKDVGIIHYRNTTDVMDQILDAISRYDAVVYVVPNNWVPLFGARKYDVPIVAAHAVPPHSENYTFIVNTDDSLRSGSIQQSSMNKVLSDTKVYELTVPGINRDIVLVGDERDPALNTTSNLLELVDTLNDMSKVGFKPLRTIQFVSFPPNCGNLWAESSANRNLLKSRVVAYLDIGGSMNGTASPLLQPRLNDAVEELAAAGAISPVTPSLTPSLFFLEHKIQTISLNLNSLDETLRLQSLMLSVLTSEPVLPFKLAGYEPELRTENVSVILEENDSKLNTIKFELGVEKPWFDFFKKLKWQKQMKLANYKLQRFEDVFTTSNNGHAVFELDSTGTKLVSNQNPKEQTKAVQRIRKFKL